MSSTDKEGVDFLFVWNVVFVCFVWERAGGGGGGGGGGGVESVRILCGQGGGGQFCADAWTSPKNEPNLKYFSIV